MFNLLRPSKNGFTLIELLVVIAIISILAAILFPVFGRARENARRSSCLSNMKQMGLGTMQYAQDYDERVQLGFWSWHVPIQPYIKSGQIFQCPSSNAKPVVMEMVVNRTMEAGGSVTGTFPTNREPANLYMPIWGHYTRNNDIFIYGGANDAYIHLPSWRKPAAEVLYLESRSPSEDDDTNDFDEDNAPYLEQGATSWNSMSAAIATRHFGGSVVGYADGHAKWQKSEWFQSNAGKMALSAPNAGCANGTNWPNPPYSTTPGTPCPTPPEPDAE